MQITHLARHRQLPRNSLRCDLDQTFKFGTERLTGVKVSGAGLATGRVGPEHNTQLRREQ